MCSVKLCCVACCVRAFVCVCWLLVLLAVGVGCVACVLSCVCVRVCVVCVAWFVCGARVCTCVGVSGVRVCVVRICVCTCVHGYVCECVCHIVSRAIWSLPKPLSAKQADPLRFRLNDSVHGLRPDHDHPEACASARPQHNGC